MSDDTMSLRGRLERSADADVLRIPKMRKGSYVPGFLEPPRMGLIADCRDGCPPWASGWGRPRRPCSGSGSCAAWSGAASQTWRQVAARLRARIPRRAAMMDEAEADVIAFLAFPKSRWPKPRSTDPIERLNRGVKRRADAVGILPNEASVTRLVGAILLERSDEWRLQHRSMTLETMAGPTSSRPP